jgi:hypothetical protein
MFGMREKDMEERVVERALRKLERAMGFAWPDTAGRATREAAEELGVEGDLEPLYRRVLAEGKRWQKAALDVLCGILEVRLPPWAEERLRDERTWEAVKVWFSPGRRWQKAFLKFFWDEGGALSFRLRRGYCSEKLCLAAWPGGALVVTVHDLYARRGYAFWMSAASWQIGEVLREVRSFAPLFAFMGLADLEEALLTLGELGDGEARTKGPYVLAREGETRLLRRGSLFGDPGLDMAFFLGRKVVLSSPGGPRLSVKAKVVKEEESGLHIGVERGRLEWEGEEVQFSSWTKEPINSINLLPDLLKGAMNAGLEPSDPSPKMRALIDTLKESEDPIGALKGEDLLRKVHLRLLFRC